MKNKIKRLSFFILALLLVSGGLIFIFQKKIIRRFIPSVEQTGNIHILVKRDTSFISSKLIIRNRSCIEIKIDSIKYKVELFHKTYLQSETALGINLPKYGSDTIDFSLKIPYKAILKDLKAERLKGDSASYSINVLLQYSTPFGKGEQPVNKVARLKIPQPPELKVEEIIYKKVQLKYILADVKVKIINYSGVNLVIKEMKYNMDVVDQGNLKGDIKETINIAPKGSTIVSIPIKIEIMHFGKTLFQVITNNDNYNYKLSIFAILESPDISNESFHLDLSKTGKIELKK